ncbi:MAG: phosphate acyltransferase PlsX, partial [Firmicutes bacterium]|nr:phosphate acyltransferase PlsX [Bacillota bacterium]
EDSPVKAARTKKDSSMIKAMSLVKDGTCDVVISAGNTGALMAGALFNLGRIKGIDRPAIGMTYPIIGEGVSFLVDAGANAECKPRNLLEFAQMGSIYMEKVLGIKNPTVGLVNIGVEETKGTPLLRETYGLLKESGLNFIGNVEGRDIPFGASDVLVCDGFVGNTVLKLTEGLAMRIMDLLKDMFTSNVKSKMGAFMLSSQIKDLKKVMDYSEYGGAPILGVRGAVIKIHGSSKANAVKSAIIKSIPYVENNVVGIISEAVEKREVPAENEQN